jgi:hypothetical protein
LAFYSPRRWLKRLHAWTGFDISALADNFSIPKLDDINTIAYFPLSRMVWDWRYPMQTPLERYFLRRFINDRVEPFKSEIFVACEPSFPGAAHRCFAAQRLSIPVLEDNSFRHTRKHRLQIVSVPGGKPFLQQLIQRASVKHHPLYNDSRTRRNHGFTEMIFLLTNHE